MIRCAAKCLRNTPLSIRRATDTRIHVHRGPLCLLDAATAQLAGAGGALSYGDAAPSLHQASALEVGAAVRSGPGQMPRFGQSTLTDSLAALQASSFVQGRADPRPATAVGCEAYLRFLGAWKWLT